MGESWQLISIENRTTAGHIGKLVEFFWWANHIVSYLKAPVIPSTYKLDTRSPEDRNEAQRLALESQSSTLLFALPVELLLIIAENLSNDYLHLLCFSLTCTFSWEITSQARYDSLCYRLKQESWSGTRIILVGEYGENAPYSKLLTDKDKAELGLHDRMDDDSHWHSCALGAALFDVACEDFRVLPFEPSNLILGDQRVRTNPQLRIELLNAECSMRCKPWISIHWKNFMFQRQNGDHWVLRNLTKREYVTLHQSRNIMQVLFILVGASEYSCFSINWTGDRIDLTVVSIHQQEHGDNANWRDVTLGVIRRLKDQAVRDDCEKRLRLV
ncbi:hypothetical protein F5880DRAFT_1612991 [Lentinula raphanica]|nr:hypothetical protein F5880DRAFT_1612991 [Lentinula raphanica]